MRCVSVMRLLDSTAFRLAGHRRNSRARSEISCPSVNHLCFRPREAALFRKSPSPKIADAPCSNRTLLAMPQEVRRQFRSSVGCVKRCPRRLLFGLQKCHTGERVGSSSRLPPPRALSSGTPTHQRSIRRPGWFSGSRVWFGQSVSCQWVSSMATSSTSVLASFVQQKVIRHLLAREFASME